MGYVVGDVHGHFETLQALVEMAPRPNEPFYFVGDLIDRGPKSCQVVDFVKQNSYQCVKGNHEQMFLWYVKGLISGDLDPFEEEDAWRWHDMHGGRETLKSYGIDLERGRIPDLSVYKIIDHYDWMAQLPRYLVTQEYTSDGKQVVISHGSIIDVWRDESEDQSIEDEIVLWRKGVHFNPSSSKIYNVFGHTPVVHPLINTSHAAIDTGCYKSSWHELTAIDLSNKKVFKHTNSDFVNSF